MIKKLRRKFIFINMLLVASVLLAVFFAVTFSAYSSYRETCNTYLEGMLDTMLRGDSFNRFEINPRQEKAFDPSMPSFSVFLDSTEKVRSLMLNNVTISETTLEAVIDTVLDSESDSGYISEYSLRFLTHNASFGSYIAFIEVSRQVSSLRETIVTQLVLLFTSLLVFFLISLFFSAWAFKPVQEAWQKQRRFISDASHELKTPLTVILANTAIMKPRANEDEAKWLASTEDASLRMKELIDDLLFLASADEGSSSAASHSRISLSDAILNGVLPFESVAFESHVTLEYEIDENIMFNGDSKQLSQLASILTDNAVKYAGNGGTVLCKLSNINDSSVFIVTNTSAPIPKSELAHIFDRFYRIDKSRSSNSGGFGLGLSIALEIALCHKATISADSSDSNTTFTVKFPRCK